MAPKLQIRYHTYSEINLLKWDQCIDQADNGLIYAQSIYLDCMAAKWDALVLNDYEAVMPLTWNKKYGFFYLYQPFLCACLGVFGKGISAGLTEAFLKAVPRRFRYWDIYLNRGNFFLSGQFPMYERVNHVLSLNNTYDELYQGFRSSYKQLLKKIEQGSSNTQKDIPIEKVMALAKDKLYPIFNIREGDYARFEALYRKLCAIGMATNYGIYSHKQELMASGVFLFDKKRAYYILAGNHPDGRTMGASHQVINAFIKDHANRQLILDFEGSDVSNIAFFFKSFGATAESYPGIIINRLPPLLSWLKS